MAIFPQLIYPLLLKVLDIEWPMYKLTIVLTVINLMKPHEIVSNLSTKCGLLCLLLLYYKVWSNGSRSIDLENLDLDLVAN